MTYKDYLNYVKGQSYQSSKIGKKYLEVIQQIGQTYDALAVQLKNQYKTQRSQLSAQSKISKANTASQLEQKGISKSGESIQSSILSDMSYMGALNALSNDEASRFNELAAQRNSAVSSVQKDMLNAQSEAARLETQMEYQRERDAESDRRWNTQYLYDINRDQIEDERAEREIARDIYEDDRDHNFETQKYIDSKSQQSFDNDMAQRELDLKKTQAQNESYIKNQYLALEKEKQEYELENAKNGSSGGDEYDFGYALNAQGFIVPQDTPDKFIDNMLKGNGMVTLSGKKFVIPDKLAQRIQQLLDDERIDKNYRNLLEICARSRGIIE